MATKVHTTMSNSADGSSSDSNSDDGMDDSSMRFEDIVLRGSKSAAGQNNPGAQWTFRTHSDRSAQMFGNLNKRVVPNADFQLQFNAVDALLLSKTKAEIKHSLAQVRLKVFDSNNGEKMIRPWHLLALSHMISSNTSTVG